MICQLCVHSKFTKLARGQKKSDIAGLKLRRFRGGQVESLNQLGKTDWGNRVTLSMNNYSQGALEHVI